MSVSLLDEILKQLDSLPEDKRKELIQQAKENTKDIPWLPNPGPQTEAYYCEADELLMGGQAGGGKSDLLVGLSLTAHKRSLVLRRTNKESEKLVDRYIEILGTRDGWNGQEKTWRIGDRVIDLAGCQHEWDKQKWKGIPHDLKCVGRGTPVLMADYTYRAIESIEVGDKVMTLEGPRLVLKSFMAKPQDCVEILCCGVTQIQSANHQVLSHNGWVSHDMLAASFRERPKGYGSREYRVSGRAQPKISRRPLSALQVPQTTYKSLKSISILQGVVRVVRYWLSQRGWLEGTALPDHKNGSVKSGGGLSILLRLQRYFYVLSEPFVRFLSSGFYGLLQPSFSHDGFGGHGTSLPSSLTGDCSSYLRLYDGRTHETSGQRIGREAVQQCLLRLADVGQRIPIYSTVDEKVQTRKYTHQKQWYDHPYTKEKRQTAFLVFDEPSCFSPCERVDLYDIEVEEVNHFITQGGIINKNCFDELVDFTESQYVFIIGWNRSADPNIRCRVVATTNPPTTPEGLWVVKRWAAWLDPNYPRPAKSGEIRWFTTIEGRDTEVDGPGPHMIDGKPIMAKSRSFIRSTLADNPDLQQSGYDSVLAGLPKELREAYREGKFDVSLKDQPFQCIPTDWVRMAMARWKDKPPHLIPMCAIGVDASGGGTDPMVIAPRYDGYYPELIKIPGESIPTDRAGKYCAGIIVSHRRDNAVVGVDMGGGYGNGIYEQLKENQIEVFGYKGAESSVRRTKEGQLKFVNKRTEVYWRFREALDPSQPGGSPISLPDDPMLLADLTAPTFEHGPNGIKLENKDSICDRLGRSPDDGDAVVISWSVGPTYLTDGGLWEQQRKEFRVNKNPQVIMGRVKRRR